MVHTLKKRMEPMEATAVDALPQGDQWQYEPKWDGFRCLAFREGDEILLQSKSGQPLTRYFPDLVAALRDVKCRQFVLDGEIAIPIAGRLSFDDLLMRVHPAASRVRMLAEKHPALYIVFDLLEDTRGRSLVEMTLAERRPRLEKLAQQCLLSSPSIRLSPATGELKLAKKWFRATGGNLDGIIAKRLDLPYRPGRRDGMLKVKHQRTADCVVGGFRYAVGKKVIGSLLVGLYDDAGKLHHVGFTSSFKDTDRTRITEAVEALVHPPGFTGRAPGGPSRWSTRRSSDWQPLRPKLVVEVSYDHFTGGRFRHGTRLLRWRPDKKPKSCTLDQIGSQSGMTLKLLKSAPRKSRS
jgi:ATP-dependent DNA ligase